MISLSVRHCFPNRTVARALAGRASSTTFPNYRFKSTSAQETDDESSHSYAIDENSDIRTEIVLFPARSSQTPNATDSKPILLNAKEHAVGYLGKVLNARVYEAAIETELQEATNLSSVRPGSGRTLRNTYLIHLFPYLRLA
jgi:hypothetical protein